MLLEPTLDTLTKLQLHGMVAALRHWQAHPPRDVLAPLDLVGLLADAEWLARENRKLTTRLKAAKLKLTACVEDIDYRHPRGLPKALVQELSASRLRVSAIVNTRIGSSWTRRSVHRERSASDAGRVS